MPRTVARAPPFAVARARVPPTRATMAASRCSPDSSRVVACMACAPAVGRWVLAVSARTDNGNPAPRSKGTAWPPNGRAMRAGGGVPKARSIRSAKVLRLPCGCAPAPRRSARLPNPNAAAPPAHWPSRSSVAMILAVPLCMARCGRSVPASPVRAARLSWLGAWDNMHCSLRGSRNSMDRGVNRLWARRARWACARACGPNGVAPRRGSRWGSGTNSGASARGCATPSGARPSCEPRAMAPGAVAGS